MLRKGLDRLFGGGLVSWMRRVTSNPVKAFAAGIVAGAVAPSSTSMAMLAVRILDQASLPAGRMFGVLMGANVGITIAVQLMVFQIERAAYPLITLGTAGFLFLNQQIARGIGQVMLALGLIFLAMGMIGEGSTALATQTDVVELFAVISRFTMLVLLGTIALAVILQSSTASIALGLGLSQAGLLSTNAMIIWVVGTNLGMAVTVLIAGWSSEEGRRLGFANLIWRMAFGSMFAIFLYATPEVISAASQAYPPERLAADLHTGFNLAAGVAALPFAGLLLGMSGWLMQSRVSAGGAAKRHFSRTLLQSPALALQHATREMFPMLDSLRFMTKTAWSMGMETNPERLSSIVSVHSDVLKARDELHQYLAQIEDDGLNEQDALWKLHLLDFSQEIAAASFLIKRHFSDAALRFASSRPELPKTALDELLAIQEITLVRIDQATGLMMTRDKQAAFNMVQDKENMTSRIRNCRGYHQRQASQDPIAAQWLPYLADFLECYRRLNSHITALACIMLPNRGTTQANENLGANC